MRTRGLRLGRRIPVWRWLLLKRLGKYHRFEAHRSPAAAVSSWLLLWINSLKQRLEAPLIGSCRDREAGGRERLLQEKDEKQPPKGHMVVYVGGGEQSDEPPLRYLVPVIHLNHPLFGELLKESEEEFGFQHSGGITIPCTPSKFERVQSLIAAGSVVARSRRYVGFYGDD
ncbi:hypothetical protein HPP92_007182 [Vanilla planifolia]|uniref:Uncharacterized protein n=1 Tax=Vanilla planifolia TaxID=51239 RepID=A0A835RJU8_VANPL|nr:hypothetical protein HPP92_007182 [Vanilla planifolia]